MNKIIILIMGIFVMAGLVYALATNSLLQKGLVGHWALDGESYDSNTERITDKTPYENHGTGNLSSVELVRNGNAETGDTSNWNFDGVDSNDYHSGAYSFYEQGGKTVTSGDFIPVDINREYNLEGWFKSNGTGGESKLYFGYVPYDENKVQIAHQHVHVILGTETTLYEACNSEDKIVKIVDGTNWYDTINHEFMAFDIDDSGNYNDLPNRELSNVNIINLTDQGDYWEVEFNTNVGKTYPIGTKVRMHISGGGYMYVAANGGLVPTSWTQYVDSSGVKGESLYGNDYDTWWRGTRYARILMLANYQQSADYKLKVDDISLIYTGATLTTDQMGQSDRAMYFDGDNDYVELSTLPTITAPYSVSFWFYPQELDTLETIVSLSGGGTFPYFLFNANNRLLAYAGSEKYRYGAKTFTADDLNKWWHVVFIVADGETLVDWKVYLNGVDNTGSPGGNTGTYYEPSTYGLIGKHISGKYFNGTISDVHIYNRALSADEIDTLYQTYRRKASAGSLQKGLVGHWTLDAESYDSNTERITDKTPYENHGTNNGSILTTDRMGQSNRAMYFDGKTARDRISFGSFSIGTTGTYNLWIKGDKTAGVQRSENIYPLGIQGKHSLLGPSMGTTERYGLITDDGTNRYYDWGNQDVYDSEWHMYTVAWDGTYVYAWLDGVSVGAPKAHSGQIFSGTGNFYAGAGWSSTYGTHTGELSEVRLYDRVLSDDEIDTLYHSYRPKASSGSLQKGLVLDMPLKLKYTKDETAGSEVMTDRTPYSNDGQNYGATVGSDYTDFDGEDDYINLGTPPSLNPGTGSWTVGGWVLARDYTYPKVRFPIGAYTTEVSGTPCWGVDDGYTSAGIRVIFCDGTNYVRSHIVCDPGYRPEDTKNNWAHIVVVFNRSTGKAYAYVNGVKQSGEVDISSVTGNVTNPYNRVSNIAGWSLDGTISDVRIYNRALSPSEIKLLYDKGR